MVSEQSVAQVILVPAQVKRFEVYSELGRALVALKTWGLGLGLRLDNNLSAKHTHEMKISMQFPTQGQSQHNKRITRHHESDVVILVRT